MDNALVALKEGREAARLTAILAALAPPGSAADVVHVVEPAGSEPSGDEAMVADAVEMLRARGLTARGLVLAPAGAGVAGALAGHARSSRAGLVVMGSRGLGHVEGMFGRSVSHALLSSLDVPVAIVPARARLPLDGIRRALVALRAEDEAAAVTEAVALVRPAPRVLAVHVPRRVAVHAGEEPGTTFVELQETSTIVLSATRRLLKRGGVEAATRSLPRDGGIARAITEVAGEWDADLIVLGSRRLRDWEGLMAGSTSHDVLRLSDRPVLIAARTPAADAGG